MVLKNETTFTAVGRTALRDEEQEKEKEVSGGVGDSSRGRDFQLINAESKAGD